MDMGILYTAVYKKTMYLKLKKNCVKRERDISLCGGCIGKCKNSRVLVYIHVPIAQLNLSSEFGRIQV